MNATVPPAGTPPLRILVVDDNRDVADSSAELLCLIGFDARACYSGSSALAEAAVFLPRVCLLDLQMPGMDGDELAVLLRVWSGDRPLALVAVTAMGNEACCHRIKVAGFDLHLVKPVEPAVLIGMLTRFSRVPRAAHAL